MESRSSLGIERGGRRRLVACLPLLALACVAAPGGPGAVDLHIVLRRVGEPELYVEVELRARGEADGETVFALEREWGGIGPEREDLVEVQASDARGEPLDVAADGPQRWRVTHRPRSPLIVRGRIRANALRTEFDGRYYRPLVEPTLFHAVGHLLLPLPEDLSDDERLEVELAFEGFAEQGFEAMSSFGPGLEPRRVQATTAELKSALFVAGELQLHRREVQGRPLLVTLDDNDWVFDGAEFADLVARVVEVERGLMHDFDEAYYWVSAIAVGEPGGHSMGGTGLAHAFALFLQPDASIELSSPAGLPLRRLLAHEYFHSWNGIRIRLAEPEEPSYWFSEGFTDHFARRVLREAGWLDDEAWAASLNELLAGYFTSPTRNLPAAELGPLFWTDTSAQREPYLRGDVAAAILDAEIRAKSRGRADLSDLMRDLVQASDRTGRRFDSDALLSAFVERAGDEAVAALRKVVVDGATAELPAQAFGERFQLREREVFAYDPGFDVEASLEARQVLGVRPGSPAERAGLSDGQRLVGWSVYAGDPERELRLDIEQDGAQLRVAFLPRGSKSRIPEVRVRAPEPSATSAPRR